MYLALRPFLFTIVASFAINAFAVQESPTTTEPVAISKPTFAGEWKTGYGKLAIYVDGKIVYGDFGNGTLKGTLDGRLLKFKYSDANGIGEGEFKLDENGQSFYGKWRKEGNKNWLPWAGKRTSSLSSFSGLWKTQYGSMRLNQTGDEIVGTYFSAGRDASIAGSVRNKRFIYRYDEGKIQGSGWFELTDNAQKLRGKWRPDGSQKWQDWTGSKIIPHIGKTWLIVLEADWETTITEPEYSFADMLEHYFKMKLASHILFRKRSFHDSKDLLKVCREIKYLAEPVVLLISTHGTTAGINVGYETIDAKTLAGAVRGASNLKLLHLSGCSMMAENYPADVFDELKQESYFPISGYKTAVGWDASAIGDFTYLSMLLIHRMNPEQAVKQSILVSPFLGEERIRGARYQALGLSIHSPQTKRNAETASTTGNITTDSNANQ